MTSLSVCIIIYNEEQNIRKCLDSVAFADEIIVYDSGSTDKTVEICREYTDKVFVTDWPGYGIQKNRAFNEASGDWILSIDADEWLTEALADNIKNAIQANANITYKFHRQTYYCGQLIRFGHWRSDHVVRLFKRGTAKYNADPVHETLIATHPIKKLPGKILHNSYINHEQVIEKMNQYTSLSANMKNSQGKKGGLTKAITHGLWSFVRSYIVNFGFLDGKAGFMLAVSFAEGSYYRYLKTGLLNHSNSRTC